MEAILDRVHGGDLKAVDVAQVLLAAERRFEHLRAVDREDRRVLVLEPTLRISAQLGTGLRRDLQVEDVFTVRRKVVPDDDPSRVPSGRPSTGTV